MKRFLIILIVVCFCFLGWTYLHNHRLKVSNPTLSPIITPFNLPPSNRPTSLPSRLPVRLVDHKVPFTSQAPFAEWDDPRQQDGCEEASSLMAISWALGQEIGSAQSARDQIVLASDYQDQKFGEFRDTSARDTVDRIIKGYFQYPHAEAYSGVSLADIKEQILQGKLVIIPANGKKLNNPYFNLGGPDRHMLLIKGYDPRTQEFITNDPGTRRGANYRYSQSTLYSAIRDYPTGNHIPIIGELKNIIVVSRP